MMMNKFHKQQNQKGFTLIELLIVVAIIGILAAIAIPQFAAYRERAFNSAAVSDLRNIKIGLEALMADYQGYPAAVDFNGQEVLVNEAAYDGDNEVIGRLSADVALVYGSDGDTFAVTTEPGNGSFMYGTASDSTAIFRAVTGSGMEATPVDVAAFGAAWTAQ